ncbi:hypothetical protein, partial [Staphylococcus simulans]
MKKGKPKKHSNKKKRTHPLPKNPKNLEKNHKLHKIKTIIIKHLLQIQQNHQTALTMQMRLT